MLPLMSDTHDETRVRMVVLVPEDHRSALRLKAAEDDKDMGDIVKEWIEKYAKDALARVRRRKAGENKASD